MRLLIFIALVMLSQISKATEKLQAPYWPCKLDSKIELNFQWGKRLINVHKLCFFNSVDNEVDTAEMMMLSVLDSYSKANGRPVFFQMIEGVNSKIEIVNILDEKLLLLSYLSGVNSYSMDVFKIDDYLILSPVGNVLSDIGPVTYIKTMQGLIFQSIELGENGNGTHLSFKYNGETLMKVKN